MLSRSIAGTNIIKVGLVPLLELRFPHPLMNTTRSFWLPVTVLFLLFATGVARAQKTRTWLMLNATSQESFFVTDPAERSSLTKAGWKIEGEGCLLPKPQEGSVPMERLVKSTGQGVDRVFATSPAELAAATKAGYINEGTLGQVSATQQLPTMIPVYHFTQGERNLWLIDESGKTWAAKSGWKFEGIAFWLWPKTAP